MTITGQSPIDLRAPLTEIPTDRPSPAYHGMSRARLTREQTTVSVVAEPGGILTAGHRPYMLVEIHSHAPAEHTLRGERADLETHLVHKATDGRIAVIGLLFDAAAASHPIDAFITPPVAGSSLDLPEPVRLNELIPRDANRFVYSGSLTTPPYTEDVQWVVYDAVQSVGQVALAAFVDAFGPTSRERQPLGDRHIELV